jgi:hypothetical protein
LLARYQQGEREQVWADLLSLGPEVREAPYLADAQAVARETMRRARHNVELIVARLRQLDYQFWDSSQLTQQKLHTIDNLMGGLRSAGINVGNVQDLMSRLTRWAGSGANQPRAVFTPPEAQIRRRMARLERSGCVLPLSLRAWMEEVGQIDLTGSHPILCFMEGEPGFSGVYADPLMIYADVDHLEETFEACREEEGADSPCPLDISFDAPGKAGLAMDAQVDDFYSIAAPDLAADALLLGERHQTTFVSYLRLCFRWGGFPGWEGQPGAPTREIAFLSEGLLDI